MIRIIDWLFVDEQTKVDEIIRVLLEINFKKGIFSYWKGKFSYSSSIFIKREQSQDQKVEILIDLNIGTLDR